MGEDRVVVEPHQLIKKVSIGRISLYRIMEPIVNQGRETYIDGLSQEQKVHGT